MDESIFTYLYYFSLDHMPISSHYIDNTNQSCFCRGEIHMIGQIPHPNEFCFVLPTFVGGKVLFEFGALH